MNRYTIEVPSLASGFKLYGAHAICLCGYDNERRAFRFKNSYGIGYADQGCAWISYDYIAKHTIDEEAFAITIDHR
jgi:C1A family cysteine protease